MKKRSSRRKLWAVEMRNLMFDIYEEKRKKWKLVSNLKIL
jgi:hypothetical protein